MKKKLLVIDDEAIILDAVKTIMEDMGYSVDVFSDVLEGENKALSSNYDLILIDIRMPQKNGAEVTRSILKAKPEAKVLIITAFPSDPLAIAALDAGAKGLLKKPFEIAKIIDFLKD